MLERLVESGIDVRIESRILEEMALFYSRCRIAFNRSLNEDLNMRVFEALCSGSMLLTDRLPVESGLERLFQDRDHLVLYDDDSLEGLVSYYLENVEEREAIAAKGRASVLVLPKPRFHDLCAMLPWVQLMRGGAARRARVVAE